MGLARRARTSRAWTRAISVIVVCAAIDAYWLTIRGEPGNGGIRRYVLGEIFDRQSVEQQFTVKANGLSSVTVHPRPASPSPTGMVVLRLLDVSNGGDLAVAELSTSVASFAQLESFTMRFPPQASLYRDYALLVGVEGSSDGQGIGLLAARGGSLRGDNYRRPRLWINSRRQFGNLVFETTVDGATSNFGSIASQLAQGGVPAPRVVLLFVLIGKYLALFAIILAFARPSSQATLGAQAPPSLPA